MDMRKKPSPRPIDLGSDCESSDESSYESDHNVGGDDDDQSTSFRIGDDEIGRAAGVAKAKKKTGGVGDDDVDDLHDSKESMFENYQDSKESLFMKEEENDDDAGSVETGNNGDVSQVAGGDLEFDTFSNIGGSVGGYGQYGGGGDESSFVSHAMALGPASGGSVCSLSVEGRLPMSSNFSTGSIGSLESFDTEMSPGECSSEEEDDFVIAVNWTPQQKSKGKIKIGGLAGNGGGDDQSLDGTGSCASIKDILPIDCISEEKPAETTIPTISAAAFDEHGELLEKPQMNDLISKIVQSTQNISIHSAKPGRSGGLKNPKSKTSSSGVGRKSYDDPLMSKYLKNKKEKENKTKKGHKRRGLGNAIGSILGSNDSLDHMKFSRSKRVVKTTHRKQAAVDDDTSAEEETGGEEDLLTGLMAA